jgi:hypothetical protein
MQPYESFNCIKKTSTKTKNFVFNSSKVCKINMLVECCEFNVKKMKIFNVVRSLCGVNCHGRAPYGEWQL